MNKCPYAKDKPCDDYKDLVTCFEECGYPVDVFDKLKNGYQLCKIEESEWPPIELRELLHNLRDRDWNVNPIYRIDENEGKKLIKAIEELTNDKDWR